MQAGCNVGCWEQCFQHLGCRSGFENYGALVGVLNIDYLYNSEDCNQGFFREEGVCFYLRAGILFGLASLKVCV